MYSSEWSLLSVAEAMTWRATGTGMYLDRTGIVCMLVRHSRHKSSGEVVYVSMTLTWHLRSIYG
jgi:hypothetical protein